jgi:hypothetical protein
VAFPPIPVIVKIDRVEVVLAVAPACCHE